MEEGREGKGPEGSSLSRASIIKGAMQVWDVDRYECWPGIGMDGAREPSLYQLYAYAYAYAYTYTMLTPILCFYLCKPISHTASRIMCSSGLFGCSYLYVCVCLPHCVSVYTHTIYCNKHQHVQVHPSPAATAAGKFYILSFLSVLCTVYFGQTLQIKSSLVYFPYFLYPP